MTQSKLNPEQAERKSHNESFLIYHDECPEKYRHVVFDTKISEILKEVSLEIAKRYEFAFIENGTVKVQVHF